jgi:Lar family restriction alleviation protein
MTTKTELKLCPFCGGEAILRNTTLQSDPEKYSRHRVMCKKCHATTREEWSFDVDLIQSDYKATKAWNPRMTTKQSVQEARDKDYIKTKLDTTTKEGVCE